MNRSTWAIMIGIIIVLLIICVSAFFIFPMMGGNGLSNWGRMGPWMMGGSGFPLIGGFGMLLFWVLIIVGIVLLVVWFARNIGQSSASTTRDESSLDSLTARDESLLDILKRRYAKGEITKEQFEEMKRDLTV